MSSTPRKIVHLDAALLRALKRAKLTAEEEGREFPNTIQQIIDVAVRRYLEEVAPKALTPPSGRPRKRPRK